MAHEGPPVGAVPFFGAALLRSAGAKDATLGVTDGSTGSLCQFSRSLVVIAL